MKRKTQTDSQHDSTKSNYRRCEHNDLQRHSTAFTLSDLELLVYPELLYGLVLANIMSPRIWSWRKDPWFARIDDLTSYRRILRLKQYIVDRYAFNLDLHTWGLTTQGRELARFQHLVDEEDLCRLSPFFGCDGDHHYFNKDIRTTFGLQDFPDEVIPYWKTETVEAMDAFHHRRDDRRGAGECVSLAALYCAALYIIAGISLEKIFILMTPLHCQVFVEAEDGLLTNNRRIVTKRMWFNGSELSRQARRSLENEQVILVAHESGFAHALYETTIDAESYCRFKVSLGSYLSSPLTPELFGNFLRQHVCYQKKFQLRWNSNGRARYLPLEIAFEEETAGSYRITDHTRSSLFKSLDRSHLSDRSLPHRVVFNDVEDLVANHQIDLNSHEDCQKLSDHLLFRDRARITSALQRFCQTVPSLPSDKIRSSRDFPKMELAVGMDRSEVLSQLRSMRDVNSLIETAFRIHRDLSQTDPSPFVLAAVQRNPVSIRAVVQRYGRCRNGCAPQGLVQFLNDLPNTSIYDGMGQIAQPDEVWNFGRGDGVEKALLLANILRHTNPLEEITVATKLEHAVLRTAQAEYAFPTDKGILEQQWEIPKSVV